MVLVFFVCFFFTTYLWVMQLDFALIYVIVVMFLNLQYTAIISKKMHLLRLRSASWVCLFDSILSFFASLNWALLGFFFVFFVHFSIRLTCGVSSILLTWSSFEFILSFLSLTVCIWIYYLFRGPFSSVLDLLRLALIHSCYINFGIPWKSCTFFSFFTMPSYVHLANSCHFLPVMQFILFPQKYSK